MKKLITVLAVSFAFTFNSHSQVTTEGFETILLAAGDAEKLVGAYMDPAMKGLIFGMNSGWAHTAKVHKVLGFDISIGLTAGMVPSENEIFRFADLNLSNTTSSSPTSATVAGSNPTPVMATFNGTIQGQNVSATFEMPDGIKDELPLNAVPTPALQLSMGLPWKLEGLLRFVPQVGSDDVKGNLFGIGLKKEITDWFGPMEKTPLHVSILAAYTTMNVDYDVQANTTVNGSGQRAEFALNSYTIEAMASLNFPVINFFGGIGYNGGTSDLRMLGTYNLEYDTGLPAPNNTVRETVIDPVNQSFTANGFKTTIGTRISLGFFKIFGSYTLQEFNMLNMGVAFSIR